MINRHSIVLGLGFGDEGKGLVTSSICNQFPFKDINNKIVVRFSGGHQAGHTVVKDNIRHVFSSFGSGTLHEIPTYWTKYCTFYPTGWLREYRDLISKGVGNIKFIIDPLAPVTTPYDILSNIYDKDNVNSHGTVGVGVGATFKRHNETPHKLYAKDIFYDDVLYHKLENIKQYYHRHDEGEVNLFIKSINEITSKNLIELQSPNYLHNYNRIVFEGSQGILLDEDFGFFPHVTRSHTTSKNAAKILKHFNETLHTYYVTRCYSTRHGYGPMHSHHYQFDDYFTSNLLETNVRAKYQGEFRKGFLNLNLLKYSIECNRTQSHSYNETLVITCMDQLKIEKIPVLINSDIHHYSTTDIAKYLGLKNILTSFSDKGLDFEE